MRKKEKSPAIDGFEYEVTQLGAIEGKRLLVTLSKIVLPALGAGIKDAPDDLTKLSLSKLKLDLGSALSALVSSADVAAVDGIVNKLAETTEVYGPGFGDAGAPLMRNFDDHFAGRYESMVKWLGFALRVNYGGFFPEKSQKSEEAAPAAASSSPGT